MKDFASSFFQDFFNKHTLSHFRSRFTAFCGRLGCNEFLSLKSLIILGFVIAVIPLFFGVMYASFAMLDASALGRTMNYEVFEQTKTVRLVLQKSSDIERKAKLFVLLSDPVLRKPYERESYDNARASFKQALNELLKLHIDKKIASLVNELSAKENLIYQQIISLETTNNSSLPIDETFQGLREASNILSREFESHVEHKFNELRQDSESLEHGLLLKGSILLIISFAFILLLLTTVSRSIKQLDVSIRRLGSGSLEEAIVVSGPSDLRFLGDRLEWLRTHLIDLEVSKHQFISNVAHEIEAPLENIRESAALLVSDQAYKPATKQRLIENIEKLKIVSEELVRYSQITNKPEMQVKENLNMKDLLESVIKNFQTDLEVKAITLKKLVRPVVLTGNREQLKIMIEQLLSNSVKYSPINGEIRIMLRDSGTQLELEIEDGGPGIEPEERTKVFEPFYRGKSGQAGDHEAGTGLGLAIVKEYVENHHGKIEVIDSRLDQPGARILVQIPLTQKA